eukprot:4332194-Amphidinium_carterae.1
MPSHNMTSTWKLKQLHKVCGIVFGMSYVTVLGLNGSSQPLDGCPCVAQVNFHEGVKWLRGMAWDAWTATGRFDEADQFHLSGPSLQKSCRQHDEHRNKLNGVSEHIGRVSNIAAVSWVSRCPLDLRS